MILQYETMGFYDAHVYLKTGFFTISVGLNITISGILIQISIFHSLIKDIKTTDTQIAEISFIIYCFLFVVYLKTAIAN